MLTAPTTRFRRNPMEVVADSIAKHGGHSVFAMRGVHSYNVTSTDLGVWAAPGSLATVRDDFIVFTPGSQPLIRRMFDEFHNPVPQDVIDAALLGSDDVDVGDESATLGRAEFSWRSNVAYVLNHELIKNAGLRWRDASGAPANAAPFAVRPYEVTIEAALLGENDSMIGTVDELVGVASFTDAAARHDVTIVLLDPTVARAHCNDVGVEMRKTYVVACDLDDAALAARRIEVDHQCMLLKGLEELSRHDAERTRNARGAAEDADSGLGSLFGFLERRGESPIRASHGFFGALDACRL
jgi:hypothetical protein